LLYFLFGGEGSYHFSTYTARSSIVPPTGGADEAANALKEPLNKISGGNMLHFVSFCAILSLALLGGLGAA
ncbi:MAG: hypothetical protein LUG55_02610, partial [Clostridiales bacterium]|nr:hypothetical protein [Clostridiales bacterium]